MIKYTNIAEHKIKCLSSFFLTLYPFLVIGISDESDVAPPIKPVQEKNYDINKNKRKKKRGKREGRKKHQ